MLRTMGRQFALHEGELIGFPFAERFGRDRCERLADFAKFMGFYWPHATEGEMRPVRAGFRLWFPLHDAGVHVGLQSFEAINVAGETRPNDARIVRARKCANGLGSKSKRPMARGDFDYRLFKMRNLSSGHAS